MENRSIQRIELMVTMDNKSKKRTVLKKILLTLLLLPIVAVIDIDTTLDAYKFGPYIKEQFKYRGAEQSFISLARNESVYNYLPFYKSLAKVNSVPMQIIWGEKDDNFALPLGKKLSEMITQAEFHIVEGGGHTPHFGQSEIVNPLLVDFLNRVEKTE